MGGCGQILKIIGLHDIQVKRPHRPGVTTVHISAQIAYQSNMHCVGAAKVCVNADNFDAAALKATRVRPDSAERMRSAFEASKHTQWMQQKVEESLADTRPNVSHEQAMASAQALIDAKRGQHAGQAAA